MVTGPSPVARSESPALWHFSQRFKDEDLEATYVQTCVQPNLQKCRQRCAFCLMLFSVYWLLTINKKYDVKVVDGLPGEKQPMQMFVLVTIGGSLLGFIGVLPWPRCLRGEIPTVLWTCPTPFLACFSSRYYCAKMMGEDPWVTWNMSGDCFTNSTILLMLDSIVTVVCLFFQMRSCMIWPAVLLIPSVYVATWYFNGSPHEPEVEVSHILLLFMLSGFSFLGRRQMERQERRQFFHVHKLGANVSDLCENLLQLEARLNAMQALMGTVCEVVFRAGENLRVVGCNKRLEELLGEMQGRVLGEKIVDEEIQERFQRVVSPLLAAPLRSQNNMMEEESSQGQGVVLVPPVTFRGQAYLGAGDSAEKSSNFDAEILVADTGMWHGAGSDAWRYLVGFKGLVQQSPRLPNTPQPIEVATAALDTLEEEIEVQKKSRSAQKRGPTVSNRSQSSRSSRSSSKSRSSPTAQQLMPISEEDQSFVPTPISTISLGLLELSEFWYLGPGTSLKTALSDAVDFLKENHNLPQDSFEQTLRPFIAGQCGNCKVLYKSELTACEMCGFPLKPRVKSTLNLQSSCSGSDSCNWSPEAGDSDADSKGRCIAIHRDADSRGSWCGGRMYSL